jgi:YidC/Oxa1 family membrane protein insertase
MSVLQGWRGWREFRNLPWEWRNLVFYSESGQDWHQFAGLIEVLNVQLGHKVCYVTSDPNDKGLLRQHENYRALCIPAGIFLITFFQVNQSDALVLTMMDLGNLHLKRSLHPVHYIYLFHGMGSTHMVDHANSFDHYDSLFCAGPHQQAEIRKREALKNLPAKHLFDYGHPRLERIMSEAKAHRSAGVALSGTGKTRPVVLVAPTWGATSIFNACGTELIDTLLRDGFEVIMRPHYQSLRQTPDVIESLRDHFHSRPGFQYIDRMEETESILSSDLLISDWSAMALEYALGLEKPVLFVDVPRRIRNPDWQELDMEPVESAIRERIGAIISPDHLAQVGGKIHDLLAHREEFAQRARELRDQVVFRPGHSISAGAAEIARLADIQKATRQKATRQKASRPDRGMDHD